MCSCERRGKWRAGTEKLSPSLWQQKANLSDSDCNVKVVHRPCCIRGQILRPNLFFRVRWGCWVSPAPQQSLAVFCSGSGFHCHCELSPLLLSVLLLYLLTFISWGSRCTWTLEMKTEIWTGNMADWHVPHYHCYICWTYVLKIKTLQYSKPWGWGPGGRPVHAPPRAFILEDDSSVRPTLANTEST